MISEEDNCNIVSDVTDEEMKNAIKSIASLYVVVSFFLSFLTSAFLDSFLFIDESCQQVQASFTFLISATG